MGEAQRGEPTATPLGTVGPKVSGSNRQRGLHGLTLRRNTSEVAKISKLSLSLFPVSLLTGSLFAVSPELRHRAVGTRPSAGLRPRPGPPVQNMYKA